MHTTVVTWPSIWKSSNLKWTDGGTAGLSGSQPMLVETLDVANAAFYPEIYVAVKMLLMYPVSACAAERSFSSM